MIELTAEELLELIKLMSDHIAASAELIDAAPVAFESFPQLKEEWNNYVDTKFELGKLVMKTGLMYYNPEDDTEV